jgi:hypothetical protein
MTILELILADLEEITPEQVAQATIAFDPPEAGEKIYGVVHSEYARRLWALAHDYEGKAVAHLHACRFDAQTPEQRAVFQRLHAIAYAKEEIARDLAWAEMRSELDVWDCQHIGLRKGFTLVESAAPARSIEAISLGALPLEILRQLRDAANKIHEDELLKKRKPS